MPVSVRKDVANYFASHGLGVINTNIFVSSKAVIPGGPGPLMSITDTGGQSPIRRQSDGHLPAYPRPTLQLRTRAASYDAAFDMCQAGYDLLIGVQNQIINGTLYLSFTPRQEVSDMGPEEGTGRAQAVVNFDVLYSRGA